MTAVSKGKTVRIQADPIEQNQPTAKLADYFRSQLKKRSGIQDVKLD